jgi:UDP:flavonoid glycosyltransferase YjiC (YdhE family)
VFKSWINSPQLVLGLFPDWFGPPQPDWPTQLSLTGFVLSDELGLEPSAAEQERLERFLSAGAPPVVFTPGSANQHAARFFQAGTGAVTRAGRRALFVTPYREHLPATLPAEIGHFSYVPFSTLFPHAAAVVHHGGIGTSAQALAAGVPQIVMPMGFDQPDNAARLKRLNVAEIIYPKTFTAPIVSAALDRILADEETRVACRSIRDRMDPDAALARACDLLEECFRRGR